MEKGVLPLAVTQEEETPALAATSTSMLVRESTSMEEIEEIPRVLPSVQGEEPSMAGGDFRIGYYNPDDRAEPPTEFDLVFHAAEAEDNVQELRSLMKRAAEYAEVSNFPIFQLVVVSSEYFS